MIIGLIKRSPLQNNISENAAEDGIPYAKDSFMPTGILYKNPFASTLLLYFLLIFICCYFRIGSAIALDMENTSSVLEMKVLISEDQTNPKIELTTSLPPKGYLVYNNHCRIVELDPYQPNVMRHFERVSYKACKQQLPLTQVDYDGNIQRYVLRVNSTAFRSYKVKNVLRCCYMSVERVDEDHVSYGPCHAFSRRAELANTTDSVIVKCKSRRKQIYINGHATIPERVAVRERLENWTSQDQGRRVPSVLLIGIDSISRMHLIRAMPKTAEYLHNNDWFELAGYNKVDDNTFPNIMAAMTGYNLENALKHCNPYQDDGLDQCEFLWKLFQKHGYVTAFGEDAVDINTFNYLKKGFKKPPVDYYMRPYLTAVEKRLDIRKIQDRIHCMGFETEAEHVYNYAFEFAQRYRNDSFFGFFWTNTHSHSDISQTSSMDDYMKNYLQRLETLEHSVVVLVSDHGLRFGPTRATWSGHFEERLPLLFIWLPKFLRQAHPEFVDALRQNRHRLTTPYDLHVTLKHILALSGRAGSLESLGGAKDCPHCQSLLLPVPLSRKCEDVAIEDHWCTCWAYDSVDKSSIRVLQLANDVVLYINDIVNNFNNGSFAHLCLPLSLLSVGEAYKAHPNDNDATHIEVYWLIFYTLPNQAKYEATVRHNNNLTDTNNMQVTGSVSRVSSFHGEAKCMDDFSIKKFCHCRTTADVGSKEFS